MRIGLTLTILLALVAVADANEEIPFGAARRLEEAGQTVKAFRAYLRIDHVEHVALRIARFDPERYLAILSEPSPDVPAWRVRLLMADLELATGERAKALAGYRSVAVDLAETALYPVEPPRRHAVYPVAPFASGPGSHRDNWLIRRFLALDAMADAEREYERIARLRAAKERPFPSNSDLLFALDHAFFLLTADRRADALDVLLEPMLTINMDRTHGAYWGLDRKDYVRLAYGVFATEGRTADFVRPVEAQVEAGVTRAIRVLAEIRRRENRLEDALRLELRYIEEEKIPEPGRSFRRGTVYEEIGNAGQAAKAYEIALAAPWASPNLPARAVGPEVPSQRPLGFADTIYSQPTFRNIVLKRLERLYTSLGRTEEMLRTLLRRWEVRPDQLEHLYQVKRAVVRFEVAGQRAILDAWARESGGSIPSASGRANIAFALGDMEGAIATIVTDVRKSPYSAPRLEEWRQRFEKVGGPVYRHFLTMLTEADPTDARSRLARLELEENLDGEEAIAVMEEILTGRARYDFRQFGKGRRVDFGNAFELAGRLMRLYEMHDRSKDIVALGLRIAREESPFEKRNQSEDWRIGPVEQANACLARAILLAEGDRFEELHAALRDSPWSSAFAQAERRRQGAWLATAPEKSFGWANLPEGVRLIAGSECVLTLARDGQYVYAGHPFGIAVYDFRGKPVTRIALSGCARAIAAQDGVIWAGGPKGLWRIERDGWKVARLPLPGKSTRVTALALAGGELWMAVGGTVQVLDTNELTVRPYSRDEVEADDRFLLVDDEVWVEDRSSGVYRYTKATDTWTRVPGKRGALRLIGLVDGLLFGSVHLGDPVRHRPCIIDRVTLAVTPVPIEVSPLRDWRWTNDPFTFFGRFEGRPVFGSRGPSLAFNAKSGKLRMLPGLAPGKVPPIESRIPVDQRHGKPFLHPDGRIGFDRRHLIHLPDGTVVVGRQTGHDPRYESPKDDWPFDTMPRNIVDGAGGLEFRFADGTVKRASSVPLADTLRGDEIYFATEDPAGRTWLGTRSGLGVLDRDLRVAGWFGTADGLLGNRMNASLRMGERLFFGGGWGDSGGCLAEFHFDKGLFTFRLRMDGLPSAKVARLTDRDGRIEISTGPEYNRSGRPRHGYRHWPLCEYDPATGEVRTSGEPAWLKDQDARDVAKPPRGAELPFLGGHVIGQRIAGDRRLVFGTRGMVILPKDREIESTMEVVEVRTVLGKRARLIADVRRRKPTTRTRESLQKALADENPYYRAQALLSASSRKNPDFVELAAPFVDDPVLRLRASAVNLLAQFEGDARVVPHLTKALDDPDATVRAHATIGLCRNGAPPAAEHLVPILAGRGLPLLPVGAWGRSGRNADRDALYAAVAPHATPEVFAVLIRYPIGADDYEPRRLTREALGKSLARNPAGLAHLLTARKQDEVRFARSVIGYAGPSILPRLYEALAGEQREVVANAAIGCGAVGDPAAIPRLLRALDFESGLVRAAVVTALGDLKAVEALPKLAEMYVLVRIDPREGWRAANAMPAFTEEVGKLAKIADLSREWDELRTVTFLREPRRERENLLDRKDILKAVENIGPEKSQAFYRRIAADDDREGRRAAAEGLAAGGEADREESLAVLRCLLADRDDGVRARAAVSLVLMDREDGRRVTLSMLAAGHADLGNILSALRRVTDAKKIEFALPRIREIAEARDGPRGYQRSAAKVLRGLRKPE